MADTAAAPVATAPTPATPEVVVAPEPAKTDTTPPVGPKRGKARHDEIRAKLAAASGTEPAKADPVTQAATSSQDTPAPEPKPDGEKPPEKPAEPEAKKPAVGAVMRLTAENTKLKGQIDELQAKVDSATKGETVAAIREKVKKDPAVLFDVFGADIDADEEKRLARLNDAFLDRRDPARKADREQDDRIAKLEGELEQERASKKELAGKDRDARARAHTAKVLTEGHAGSDGVVVIDPAKYPYVNHLTKTGEFDAHGGVMFATRDMADEFREKHKRDPNDEEIVAMVGIAAAATEEYLAKRAKNWQLPSAAPTPVPEPERKTPTTIGSGLGSRSPSAVDTSGLSKTEKHERIREKLRRAQAQAVPN